MAVSVEEALALIYENVKPKGSKILALEEALGFVLFEDIYASHNLPPFDNSAMDGYALKLCDSASEVKVEHTIFAGDNFEGKLECGHAIKIMTGARIPFGCECVVPIEETKPTDDGIVVPDNLVLSKHIRFCGEDIKKGELLLHKGQKIQAHHITLLASQGISHIKVYKKPRVALFASGSELKMHFESVEEYQLYNTNTPTFMARAKELGCEVEFIGTAKDSLEEIREYIREALSCDLIITSGGVSVGDADFTKEAFEHFGFTKYFEKVEIKPGKPTTFGCVGESFILNLPGNPLAAALNFELFAQSIILALSGSNERFIRPIKAKMAHDYRLKGAKRTLLPGYFDGEYFTICEKFAPGMISPLATSNSFIMVDESCNLLACENEVNIISTRFDFYGKKPQSLVSR